MRSLFPLARQARQRSIARARQHRLGQRGVTALEFALVAPTAILVLFFAIEMAIMMMADATLGKVAADIARQGQIYRFSSSDCTSSVRSMLASGMSNWVYNPDDLIVEVEVYTPGGFTPNPPPAPADDPDYEQLCSAGGRNALLAYTVGFSSPGFSGILRLLNIDFMRFERGILFQNEP